MQRHRTGIALAMLTILGITPFVANAQVGAESLANFGCHTITAEEQAGLLAMGATIPANGMFCDKDKGLLYGGCTENPYPYLQTKNKTGRADSVSGLNSDFACRMYKFLKAADATGMNIAIGSGYRSVTMQTGMYNAWVAGGKSGPPVAPPGRSKHNFGLAVDLHYNGTIGPRNTAQCVATLPPCKWAHSNEAQYGLRWPMEYEPWHIEPSGTVNGRQQPLPQGGWTGDQTSTPYTNTGAPYSPSMWQPQMAPQPQQFSPLGSTGTPSPTYTQPTTSYPTNYDGVPLPTATSSIFTVPPPYSYPLATTTEKSSTTNVPSAYDQLKLIAAGTSNGTSQSYQAATSVPTQLNNDLNDIDGGTNTGGSNFGDEVTDGTLAVNSVAVNPIHVTETFTGTQPTIVQSATSGTNVAANKSLIVALLTTLRDLLVSFVHILQSRPTYGFQGSWQVPATSALYR